MVTPVNPLNITIADLFLLLLPLQMLRELLTESRDYGTLLGGGSAAGGGGGALAAYVSDPEECRRLFEAIAYECQVGMRDPHSHHSDVSQHMAPIDT
jgi:hypothetical protein